MNYPDIEANTSERRKPESTVLLKAFDIVYNRKDDSGLRPYGPFRQCMEKATAIFNAMVPSSTSMLEPKDMYYALIALKFAREAFEHKQDNLIDACGYIAGLDDYINEMCVRVDK